METVQYIFDHEDSRNFFKPIDIDAPGGFARVVRVSTKKYDELQTEFAFKVMRHDLRSSEKVRLHFENEIALLYKINEYKKDTKIVRPVTRIYDSGYVPVKVVESIESYRKPDINLPIVRTAGNIEEFIKQGEELDTDEWVPFLLVEMAGFNDSLFRQIQRRPSENHRRELYRLPTGELIVMATQLLDLMTWLHNTLGIAYIDWKPEHIHWNGEEVKLIDWNVTSPLRKNPGPAKNIRDDVRLFCGAALYCGLTLLDPEGGKKIGPRPTRDIVGAIDETRRRYLTDDPQFYQAESFLDEQIKQIVRKGLNPKDGYESPEELKQALQDYARSQLGLIINNVVQDHENEIDPEGDAGFEYWLALKKVREAQRNLSDAFDHLKTATRIRGGNEEFDRLAQVISEVQRNFPLP